MGLYGMGFLGTANWLGRGNLEIVAAILAFSSGKTLGEKRLKNDISGKRKSFCLCHVVMDGRIVRQKVKTVIGMQSHRLTFFEFRKLKLFHF